MTGMNLIKAGFKVSSYTFGTPRLGNKEYLAYSDDMFEDVRHVVWHQDPTPHNPNNNILEVYVNSCPKSYLNPDLTVNECQCDADMTNCSG